MSRIHVKNMSSRIRKVVVASLAGAAFGLGPLAVVVPGAYAASGGAAGADSVALSYVQANYGGSGTAQVLKTEADVDKGVPVYDVRTLAPNGTVYVVQVAQSNDAVVSASVAEGQAATTGASPSDAPDHAATASPSNDGTSAEQGDASQGASTAPAGTNDAALAPTSGFSPCWVQSFAPSVTLWSGSDSRALAFGSQGQGSAFLVVQPQAGSRLFVYNPLTHDFAYVSATSVGPGPAAA
ncbi:MAG: PepSY domain-containing protein [Chloroflexota bacterium]